MSAPPDNAPIFGSKKNTRVREYFGLRNQGSTCYLNSVLQVLFMTEDFREAVGRCPKHCEDPIDHQLNTLFENLKERTGTTYEVTKKLGIDKVNEQRDAGEYLENILTLASDEAAKIFDVQLSDRTICMGCEEVTDEEKSFWNLPLPLKNSSDETYSVTEAIHEFFKDSHCIGDNQLYCENCQDKRDATIKCVVNRHPEVLMLLLKRFEFNYYQMCYVKNTRVVDVPCTVQIPQNQTYELYAFVEHFGSLKSGHYTATIKCQDEDIWYDFNDSSVRKLNNPPFKGNTIERTQSAYLLFYRKKGTDLVNRKVSHNNKDSRCRPYVFKIETGEDHSEGNKISSPIGHISHPQPSIDLANTQEINHSTTVLPESQNRKGAKKPFHDELGSQGEPDNQVKTSEDDDSLPKRRKICENVDKGGKTGPTGRQSDGKVEGNRESTLQEAERLNNGKQPPLEQTKHEKRESFSEQASYQASSQVESSGAMQIIHVQKKAVRTDVHGDRNKQVHNHYQIEKKTELKPNQYDITASQDQKNLTDCAQKNRTDQTLSQEHASIKKQGKQKGKLDEHSHIINAPSKSDELEEKQNVDSNKEITKPKGNVLSRFFPKRNKSKKGQLKAESQRVEERSQSNVQNMKDKNRKGNKKGVQSQQKQSKPSNQKVKPDEHSQIINAPASFKTDELEQKQNVDGNKERTKAKGNFLSRLFPKRNKSKKGHLKTESQRVEERSESNVQNMKDKNRKGNKKGVQSQHEDDTEKWEAKVEKKKSSLNCFGK